MNHDEGTTPTAPTYTAPGTGTAAPDTAAPNIDTAAPNATPTTPVHAPSGFRAWPLPWIIGLALLLGAGAGVLAVRDTGPTATPQSCLDALDAAGELLTITGQAVAVGGEAFKMLGDLATLSSRAVRAAVGRDIVTLRAATAELQGLEDRMDSARSRIEGFSAKVGVTGPRYERARDDCRRA